MKGLEARVEGVAATSVRTGAVVELRCTYSIRLNSKSAPAWRGDVSVDGEVLRTFGGEQLAGSHTQSVTFPADRARIAKAVCRLDVDGVNGPPQERAIEIQIVQAATLSCPPTLEAKVSAALRGAVVGQVAVDLDLTGSERTADSFVCRYGSRSGDVREVRATFPCRDAVPITGAIADGTSNTVLQGETPGGEAASYSCRTR